MLLSTSLPPRAIFIAVISLCLIVLLSSHFYSSAPSKWKPLHPSAKRALVVPTVDIESVEWIHWERLKPLDLHPVLYCMGENTTHPECRIPRTRNGNEAGAYISYILDHYDRLPDYSVFMHDNKDQWHNDVAGTGQEFVLSNVRWQNIDVMGFVNLRCMHNPGCLVDITPFSVDDGQIEMNTTRARFLGIYQELFGVGIDEVPKEIGNACCAQFIVTRAQILKRPRSDYERLMKWLIESDSDGSHSKGWAFEKIWHIIFGMTPIYCPREEQCKCDVYGWCGPLQTGEILQPIGSRYY